MAEDEQTEETRREGRGSRPSLKTIARGERIGRYVVADQIGEGGMGVVFAATDPELVRDVAIKLVRPGGGVGSQARLLREAQAMARLSHPNVVAIYDVGTHAGGVFLAMELVPGETLRRWLKREKRGWREVLELFRGAGRGLVAAHAAGIVHRDFKLDNVLVDGEGRARVTDFGLARREDDADPEARAEASPDLLASPLTQTGAVVGTPAYMAPEQRSPSTPTDARSDEFSFCVSLYEALYGERPIARDGAPREPPAGASVPRWIRRVLVRGLASDPEARYPSMAALLDALARDPAARKRKIALAAGAAAVAVTAGVLLWPAQRDTGCDSDAAFAGTWSDAHRGVARAAFAKSGKSYADNAFATTAAHLDRFAASWKAERDKACRDTRERHEQSEEVMLLRMACLERQRTELASFVGVLEAPDDKVVELSAQASGTLSRPAECDDPHQLVATVKLPADPKIRAEIDSLRQALATSSALPVVGKPADAIKRYLPIGVRAKEIAYRPLEAEAFFALGLAYQTQGDYKSAVDAYRTAVLAAEAGGVDRLAVRACARIAGSLAAIQVSEADAWLERGAAILERLGGNDRLLVADYEYARGVVAGEAGRDQDAVVHLRKSLETRLELLGPDHPDTLLARVNVAAYADELALAKEAIEQDTAAIAGFERTLGRDHPRLTIVVANLGLIRLRVGDVAEADRLVARAAELAKAYGPKTRRAAIVAVIQCWIRLEQSRADEALAYADEAAAGFSASGLEKSDPYGETRSCRGAALLALGKSRDGIDALEKGIAIRDATNPNRLAIASDLTRLAEAELANGNQADALARAERALELSSHGTRYPGELARTRFALARALVATRGDRARAIELATQARDELAPLPYRAALAAQVTDWLSKTRL